MGFRFRKSVNIGPVRFTASKSGISASAGVKGLRVTKTARGRSRVTASVPGTGVSYVKETGGGKQMKKPFYKRWWFIALGVLLVLGAIGSGGKSAAPAQEPEPTTAIVTEAPVERTAPTPAPDPTAEPTPRVELWVVNTSTGKFHDPHCRAVSSMSDSNKLEIEATRGEMIDAGYIECDICK